jgi:hypothetical protein
MTALGRLYESTWNKEVLTVLLVLAGSKVIDWLKQKAPLYHNLRQLRQEK